MVKIQGYHACKVDGGWSYIWKNAPFLSEPNDRQWLTQGYYFWTDSDYFAHKWGENSIKGDYAIVECLIEIDKSLLLDLVGSVEDQLRFQAMLTKFEKKLKNINPQAKATMIEVLAFYRNEAKDNKEIFPYSAIKVQDEYSNSKVAFIKNKNERLPLVTRQQLCLFEVAVNCIKSRDIIHPEQFKESCISSNI
ncbi:MAG: hypothetical protein WCS87_02375 [Methylococcaceae bacterium]